MFKNNMLNWIFKINHIKL